jgi:spore germination cell wall hydrolase CwlJ-like protein
MVIEAALLCLSLNVFYEARGESVPGQYAVAQVTMNRAGGDQRRVCDVVYAPRQFSWTHQKVRHRKPWKTDPEAWERARIIARIVIQRPTLMNVLVNDADHYHATYVNPRWIFGLQRTARIGRHIFYAST